MMQKKRKIVGNYRQILLFVGLLTLITAFLHGLLGFSPELSLYFGAPEELVQNNVLLRITCILIGVLIAVLGIYAISGGGYIRSLPWTKQVLASVSFLLILRGILFIPELLVVFGLLEVSFPVAPQYVVFSVGILLVGLIYLVGTVGLYRSLSTK